MRWTALYRRRPILRGVSASEIRADYVANRADKRSLGPALPSSPELRGGADAMASVHEPGDSDGYLDPSQRRRSSVAVASRRIQSRLIVMGAAKDVNVGVD